VLCIWADALQHSGTIQCFYSGKITSSLDFQQYINNQTMFQDQWPVQAPKYRAAGLNSLDSLAPKMDLCSMSPRLKSSVKQ
jgi:hypothetical protein